MEYPEFVKGQIYVITNKSSQKVYVGQVRSHYRNRDKWTNAGYLHRFRSHLTEARKMYRFESAKLNRAIRKYGEDQFACELIHECLPEETDAWEQFWIFMYNSFEHGYNLTEGGKNASPSELVRMSISKTLVAISDASRLDLLEGKVINTVKISQITCGTLTIASLNFRLETDTLKIDFGGKMSTLEESLHRAVKFALLTVGENQIVVQDRIKHLVNLPNALSDDKLEQNSVSQKKDIEKRYQKLKDIHIESIRIEKRVSCGKTLATLIINNKQKYVNFGGKFVDFNESFSNAVELSLLLTEKSKIRLQHGLSHPSI